MQNHEFLNIDRYKSTLVDTSKYFIHTDDRIPKIIEHATGEARYIVDTLGVLRPFADYRAGKIPQEELPMATPLGHSYEFGPRPPTSSGMGLKSEPGKFQFAGTVEPPKG